VRCTPSSNGTIRCVAKSLLPLSGLQIDRAQVFAASETARRTCRAVCALAGALGIESIAPGIDEEETRGRIIELGFTHGCGELFRHSRQDRDDALPEARSG